MKQFFNSDKYCQRSNIFICVTCCILKTNQNEKKMYTPSPVINFGDNINDQTSKCPKIWDYSYTVWIYPLGKKLYA